MEKGEPINVASLLLQNQCLMLEKPNIELILFFEYGCGGFIGREPNFLWDRINESNFGFSGKLNNCSYSSDKSSWSHITSFMYMDKIEIMKCTKGED